MISFPRLLLTGVLLFGFVALSAAQARAAQTPAPDPYPPRNAAPSVPTPDPYPSSTKPKPTPTPAPTPAPAVTPRSSASDIADARQTAPKAQKPKPSANQSGRNSTERVAAPQTALEKKPKVAAAAAVAAVRNATSGRALLLGGLALLALVLASGSMLFLLIRSEGWEARP